MGSQVRKKGCDDEVLELFGSYDHSLGSPGGIRLVAVTCLSVIRAT
jgi:hypothetical protein